MNQTKVFDEIAKSMGNFTFESILLKLENDSRWNKDKGYLKGIIKDRIKRKVISTTGENSYKYEKNEQSINKEDTKKFILKYNDKIGVTEDFQKLLNKGVLTYENPTNLVKLSLDNSIKIENMISNDDRYKFLFSKIVFDSCCELNTSTHVKEFKRDRDSYTAVLIMIDSDNSTQVFGKNRKDFYRIINFIINDEERFYERLKNNDISLVNDLINQCSENLISFCSKVCKFLNQWMFNGDGYYIYDYYVLNIIPYYLEYYKNNYSEEYKSLNIDVSKINDRDYCYFYNLLSKVHSLRNYEFKDSISKDLLDHIMWYSYRSYKQSGRKIYYN